MQFMLSIKRKLMPSVYIIWKIMNSMDLSSQVFFLECVNQVEDKVDEVVAHNSR